MSLILRVDIEKPYGNHTVIRKVLSKLIENYYPEAPKLLGYLDHLNGFLKYLRENQIKATFFHRLNNLPNSEIINLYQEAGHQFGLHFENSRSKETLKREIDQFKNRMNFIPRIISKHGSGYYRLGKYHYAPYEPEKYKLWAHELNIEFPSGNGIPESKNDLIQNNGYYECLFWLEDEYRSRNFHLIEDFMELAKKEDVVLLIHPESFYNLKDVRKDFAHIISLAKENNIDWKLL